MEPTEVKDHTKRALRKVYVLREWECEMEDLKHNDIFRVEKAGPADKIDPTQFFIVDGNPTQEKGSKEIAVNATPISFIKTENYRVVDNFRFVPESIAKVFRAKQEEAKNAKQPNGV